MLRSPRSRPLLVGGDAWVIDLGRTFQTAGLDVLMWAGLERRARADQPRPLCQLAPGELLASVTADRADPSGINTVLLLTGEDDFNALAAAVLRYSVGDRVFRVGPPAGGRGVVAPFTGGDVLFGHALNRSTLASRYENGAPGSWPCAPPRWRPARRARPAVPGAGRRPPGPRHPAAPPIPARRRHRGRAQRSAG